MKIKAIMRPNQEEDVQTFDLADFDLTKEEWDEMSLDKQKELLYEVIVDNIYGIVDEIVEY